MIIWLEKEQSSVQEVFHLILPLYLTAQSSAFGRNAIVKIEPGNDSLMGARNHKKLIMNYVHTLSFSWWRIFASSTAVYLWRVYLVWRSFWAERTNEMNKKTTTLFMCSGELKLYRRWCGVFFCVSCCWKHMTPTILNMHVHGDAYLFIELLSFSSSFLCACEWIFIQKYRRFMYSYKSWLIFADAKSIWWQTFRI